MARNLEAITLAYWEVRTAVHLPDTSPMSASEANKKLNKMDLLRPTDWRLSALMHEVKFDIIEGNTEWRDKRQVVGSVSMLHTKD